MLSGYRFVKQCYADLFAHRVFRGWISLDDCRKGVSLCLLNTLHRDSRDGRGHLFFFRLRRLFSLTTNDTNAHEWGSRVPSFALATLLSFVKIGVHSSIPARLRHAGGRGSFFSRLRRFFSLTTNDTNAHE